MNMNICFRLIVGICDFSREALRVVLGAAYSARMTMVCGRRPPNGFRWPTGNSEAACAWFRHVHKVTKNKPRSCNFIATACEANGYFLYESNIKANHVVQAASMRESWQQSTIVSHWATTPFGWFRAQGSIAFCIGLINLRAESGVCADVNWCYWNEHQAYFLVRALYVQAMWCVCRQWVTSKSSEVQRRVDVWYFPGQLLDCMPSSKF